MLALIGNLDILELVVIAAVAVMVFGKRLPEVAMRGAAQVMRLRREVSKMWREAGLEDELRKVRHELDHAVPTDLSADMLIEAAEREADKQREGVIGTSPQDVGALDPLSREALEAEPGHEVEEYSEPGHEDSMDELAQEYSGDEDPREEPQTPWGGDDGTASDPTLQARTEPTHDDDEPVDEPADDGSDAEEKESA